MNDPFLQGGFKKANLLLLISFLAENLDSTQCVLCRSHEQKYAQLHFKKCVYKPFYKKKKRKLETRQWVPCLQ